MRAISASSRSPTVSGDGRPSPSSASRYASNRSAASSSRRRSSSTIGRISEERGAAQRAVLEDSGVAAADPHRAGRLGDALALQESQLEHAAVVIGEAAKKRLDAAPSP